MSLDPDEVQPRVPAWLWLITVVFLGYAFLAQFAILVSWKFGLASEDWLVEHLLPFWLFWTNPLVLIWAIWLQGHGSGTKGYRNALRIFLIADFVCFGLVLYIALHSL